VFVYTAAATTFSLMAVIAERGKAEAALAEHNRSLEAKVAERTAELQQINEQLESKVAERTAELHQINEQLEATVAERTAELRAKLALIEQQQETLMLLSTPVLKLWE